MKIRKIRLNNINSLKGIHEVDFMADPLKSAGLFAITGPTGSGKTTLLDVIALALYNQVPRIDQKITKTAVEKTGSLMTHNTTECFAEVEYSCIKGIFKSKWSISLSRNNTFRDYDMELSDEEGNILDLKKSDIPSKNEELTGLNYEQFIRSIMLAQGDFAKFLKSNKEDRGKLLEKITGTEIYRLLGQKAYEKYAVQGKLLENLQLKEKNLLERKLTDTERADLQQLLSESKNKKEQLEQQLTKLDRSIQLKRECEKQVAEIQSKEAALSKAKEAIAHFEQNEGIQLQKHENLVPYQADLIEWRRNKDTKKKLDSQKITLEKQIAAAEKALNLNNEYAFGLLGKTTAPEQLAPSLDALQKQVLEYQQAIKELRISYSEKQAQTKALFSELELQQAKDIETDLIRLSELKNDLKDKIQALQNALDHSLLSDSKAHLELLVSTQKYIAEWKHINASLSENNTAQQEIEKHCKTIEKSLIDLPPSIEKQTDLVKIKSLALDSLANELAIERLKAKYEDDRTRLQANEACPLCGSLEHPYVVDYKTGDISLIEKNIQTQKSLLQQEQQELQKLQIQLQQAQKELIQTQNNLQTINSKVQKQTKDLQALIDKIPKEYTSLSPEKAEVLIQQQIAALNEYSRLENRNKSIEKLLPIINNLIELKHKGQEINNSIKAIYNGENIEKEISTWKEKHQTYTQIRRDCNHDFSHWEKEYKDTNQIIDALETSLIDQLKPLNITDIDTAYLSLLNNTIYQDLKTKRASLQESSAALATTIATLNKALEIKQQSDDNEHQLEILEQQLAASTTTKKQTELDYNQYFAQETEQKKIDQELSNTATEIATEKSKNKKWLLLKEYIGDATGNKFSVFAQGLTLRYLVYLANKRLTHLSERYQLSIPDEKEDDNLVIIDHDMGSIRRSVKTLSGGESFLISLALALGLSDLASQKVEIKSLFIDEGFGTLDPATLDLTLDTLEKLQHETDKTIGIISHVESLKERISTQIEVVRNGRGYSTLLVRNK